jgi:hypothetical protein
MTLTFDTIWARINQELRPGTIIRNWGLARSYTGGSFEVKDVERTSITVAGGNMQMSRIVSRGEFEKVFAVWADYAAGNYPRSKMTGLSQNTTYIISILHHLGLG